MSRYKDSQVHLNDDEIRDFVCGDVEPGEESLMDSHLRMCSSCKGDAREMQDRLGASRKNLGYPSPNVLS